MFKGFIGRRADRKKNISPFFLSSVVIHFLSFFRVCENKKNLFEAVRGLSVNSLRNIITERINIAGRIKRNYETRFRERYDSMKGEYDEDNRIMIS